MGNSQRRTYSSSECHVYANGELGYRLTNKIHSSRGSLQHDPAWTTSVNWTRSSTVIVRFFYVSGAHVTPTAMSQLEIVVDAQHTPLPYLPQHQARRDSLCHLAIFHFVNTSILGSVLSLSQMHSHLWYRVVQKTDWLATDVMNVYSCIMHTFYPRCQLSTPTFRFVSHSRPYLVRSRLCYSVASVSVCTECIVAKRCVLEQKLLLTANRK